MDYTPIHGSMIDLPRFAELGKKEVLALMSDPHGNAERPGYTMSEREQSERHIAAHPVDRSEQSRIIVATFASNVDRVQQIFECGRDHGRKVVVMGRSMINVVDTAMETGYLEVPGKRILIEGSEMSMTIRMRRLSS